MRWRVSRWEVMTRTGEDQVVILSFLGPKQSQVRATMKKAHTLARETSHAGILMLPGAVVLMVLLLAIAAYPQSTSAILGVIKDSNGAVVPGAVITIVNTETAQTRTVTTGGDGAYRVSGLPAGRYTIKVEKQDSEPRHNRTRPLRLPRI